MKIFLILIHLSNVLAPSPLSFCLSGLRGLVGGDYREADWFELAGVNATSPVFPSEVASGYFICLIDNLMETSAVCVQITFNGSIFSVLHNLVEGEEIDEENREGICGPADALSLVYLCSGINDQHLRMRQR